MNNYRIVYPNELSHYGVRGMKWGVRKQSEVYGSRQQKWAARSQNARTRLGKARADYNESYYKYKKDEAKSVEKALEKGDVKKAVRAKYGGERIARELGFKADVASKKAARQTKEKKRAKYEAEARKYKSAQKAIQDANKSGNSIDRVKKATKNMMNTSYKDASGKKKRT